MFYECGKRGIHVTSEGGPWKDVKALRGIVVMSRQDYVAKYDRWIVDKAIAWHL